nr:unnamed protein product [Callosobruchus chinensis]
MKLGDTFNSYEDFLAALENYSQREFVSFWKRDARTISAAQKKTERFIDPKLFNSKMKKFPIPLKSASKMKVWIMLT